MKARQAGQQAAPPNNFALGEKLRASMSESKSLASKLRSQFETRFRHSFADVRVISSGTSSRIAESLNARAFTVGRNIWFGNGEYRPDTLSGQKLLAHELAHTIQQGQGSDTGIQKEMVIGKQNDAAESEADAIASAVVKNREIPRIQQEGRVLRREARQSCSVSEESSPDQVLVNCGDQRYRVTVMVVPSQEAETRTSANWGYNNEQVRLDIEICHGQTAVTVTPSINLPPAFEQVVRNILRREDVLEGVTITPELRITILRSESYSVSVGGGPIIDLGRQRVIGGRAGVRVETGPVNVEVGGEIRTEPGQPTTYSGTVGVSEGSTPESRDCTRTVKRLMMRCERLTTIPAVPAVPAQTAELTDEVFLTFPYAKSDPVEQVLLRTGNSAPVPSSAASIISLIDQGYRVQSIEGFASPEGPMYAPTRAVAAGRFPGNQPLSEARASAARQWLINNVPGSEAESVTPAGRGELFESELEGRQLTETTTSEFLGSEDPLRPASEQERQAIAGSSAREQRANVFPRLRRARIVLTRTVEVSPARPAIPAREEPTGVTCPDEVRRAVTRHYRLPIMT